MNRQVDSWITSAQDLDGGWDDGRAARIRDGARRSRDLRHRRERTVRRGAAALGGVLALAIAFLRVGSLEAAAPDGTMAQDQASTLRQAPSASELLAARVQDDAGYTRD
jgi:hypothetical protein